MLRTLLSRSSHQLTAVASATRPSLFARSMSAAAASQQLTFSKYPFLAKLGLQESNAGVFNGAFVQGKGVTFTSMNPATNEPIATISTGDKDQLESCVQAMDRAKPKFAGLPLPQRGDLVRQIGESLRAHKTELGALVSLEMGKITAEGLGEVQEGTCAHSQQAKHSRKNLRVPAMRRAAPQVCLVFCLPVL